FSSRRRHTRWPRDWSSDVCSSDLTGGSSGIGQAIAVRLGEEGVDVAINYVGRPEGAEETREAIEHGVDLCMRQLSASGTKPILRSEERRVGKECRSGGSTEH